MTEQEFGKLVSVLVNKAQHYQWSLHCGTDIGVQVATEERDAARLALESAFAERQELQSNLNALLAAALRVRECRSPAVCDDCFEGLGEAIDACLKATP